MLVVSRLFCFSLLLPLAFVIDAEILVPPGTTEDIIYQFQLPVRITEDQKIFTGGNTKKRAGTGVLRPVILPPRTPPPFNISFSEVLGVSSIDFDMEYNQIAAMKAPDDPLLKWLNYRENSYEVVRSRLDVYFKCFTRVLMRLFHNNRMIDSNDIFYLTLFGNPAAGFSVGNELFITWDDKTKPPDDVFSTFCKRALNYVGRNENEKLQFLRSENPYENMMLRLVTLELISSYPFTVVTPFAPGLDNFARDELYPIVGRIAKEGKTKRLRQNAVYYMGMMQKYEPMQFLMDVLKNSTDNVSRARALFFLTAAKFDGLADYLIKQFSAEDDPVIRVAMVNSLKRIGDKRAFPVVVNSFLKGHSDDFDLNFALLKACIACMDSGKRDIVEAFLDGCKKLEEKIDAREVMWVNDPPLTRQLNPQLGYPPSYKYDTRKKAVRNLLDIALAVSGDRERENKLNKLFESMLDRIPDKVFKGDRISAVDDSVTKQMAFTTNNVTLFNPHFESITFPFIVEQLPRFGNTGKKFLEKLLLSAYSHDYMIFTALETYVNAYPDDYPSLVRRMLRRDLPVTVLDRAIQYLFGRSLYDDKLIREVAAIAKRYNPSMSNADKHLVSMALFYTGGREIKGKPVLTGRAVTHIIEKELKLRQEKDTDFGQDRGIYYMKFPDENKLLEIALEKLALYKSGRAEEFLLETLGDERDARIRRIIAKGLGNFDSKAVKSALLGLLTDGDGWTRLIAYQSLSRITKVDHKVDWFFSPPGVLSEEAGKYRKKLEDNKEI